MDTHYLDRLYHHIERRPDAVAFRAFKGGEALTFGALDERARCYGAGLQSLGVQRQDRVVAILETSLSLPVVLLGHYALGAVHVPVNTRYGEVEIAHILEDSGAKVAVVDTLSMLELLRALRQKNPAMLEHLILLGEAETRAELRDGEVFFSSLLEHAALERRVEVEDEDLAMFIYTSGTTGKSKGVALPYRAIIAGIDSLTTLWRWTEEDVLVLALPLFHVHGLGIGVHGTLLKGCEAILQERFDAGDVVTSIEQGGTIFMGVPTMYTRLVRALEEDPSAGEVLARARLFTSGSAALAADLFKTFERFTGHRILERYGMSETMLTVSNPYPPEQRKPGTIGFPISACEVEVRDDEMNRCEPGVVGQIVVRGDTVMREYWGSPEKTAEAFRDGWFLTGDAARYDEDGYIVHVGRRSVDILKSGGYKISAREIEEVISRHPLIREVAVVGIPDPEWGQRIGAAIVVDSHEESARDASWWAGELRAFVEGKLADYKRPREVLLLDEIPRNALGKVQKHRIDFGG